MDDFQRIAVTIPEAVSLSGLSRSTLYEVFKTRGITPRKQGRRTLILVHELRNYLEALPSAQEGGNDGF